MHEMLENGQSPPNPRSRRAPEGRVTAPRPVVVGKGPRLGWRRLRPGYNKVRPFRRPLRSRQGECRRRQLRGLFQLFGAPGTLWPRRSRAARPDTSGEAAARATALPYYGRRCQLRLRAATSLGFQTHLAE